MQIRDILGMAGLAGSSLLILLIAMAAQAPQRQSPLDRAGYTIPLMAGR